jgi:peptidoglycan/LPS O-acetylase OafA/YrhL
VERPGGIDGARIGVAAPVTPVAPARGELRQLTGIRIIAALWVVLFHFSSAVGALVPELAGIGSLARDGYLAVDLFFVLSGYIISYQYFDAFATGRGGYRRFLVRRLARIYPAHLAALALLVIGVLGAARLGHPLRNHTYLSETGLGFDVLLTRGWVTPSQGWNFPSWSLSAEWLAYLLVPLVVLCIRRLRDSRRGLAALLVVLVLLEGVADALLPSFNGMPAPTPRVLLAFTAGSALFLMTRGIRAPRLDLVGGIALVVLILGSPLIPTGPGKAALSLLLCLAAIGFLAVGSGPVTRLLGSPPLEYGGRISYSVYIVHGAALIALTNLLPPTTLSMSLPARLALAAGVLVAVIALGAAMFHGVERPGRDLVVRLVPARSGRADRRPPVGARIGLRQRP